MKIKILVISFAVLLGMFVPALAAEGRFGASLTGGWAWSTESDALDGRDGDSGPASSSFDSTWTLGGEAFWWHSKGFSFGLGIHYWEMVAQAARSGGSENDFLSVETIPVYALVRYTQPVEKGVSWHAEAGAGYAFIDGGKEQGLSAMEAGIGQNINLDTDNSFCMFLGVGADYFFNSRTSLGLNLRH
jgi:hypothetical protein